MTKSNFAYRFASLSLVLLFVASSVGCQSSGGSRWAWWNPWSGASDDATLVARTAPALPSETATPLIEGATAPAAAIASTTPAARSAAPTIPTIETAGTAPAFNSSPTAESAKIASTPAIPSKPVDPAMQAPSYPIAAIPAMASTNPTSSATSGPYDPNGYKETAPAVVASTPTTAGDRYGNLGNRYASTAPTNTPEFKYEPAVASTTPVVSTPAVSTPASTTTNNSVVGDRYGSYAAAPVSSYQPPVQQPAATTTPNTPVDRYATTTPSYSATPTQATGAIVASNSNDLGSEVRLVSSPGEYRPGGTSTYSGSMAPSSMNIATKPDAPGSSIATPSYPSSGNRYQ